MSDPFPIAPVGPERLDEFLRATESAFHTYPTAQWLETERSVFEADRTLAAFDGDRIVGTTAIFTFRMAVPGGDAATAGVTAVGVDPTYRRRGILTSLMRRQLDDIHDRGEPLAALWASESPIYWRFGYGVAAYGAIVSIDRALVRFLPTAAGRGTGRLRMVDKDEFFRLAPPVHDAVMATRPGMVSRTEAFWRNRFSDREDERDGSSALFFVVHGAEDEGGVDGYAAYRFKTNWDATGPLGTVHVEELLGSTTDAHGQLWRFCLDLDLSSKTEAWNVPVDDAFFHMLADPRRAESRAKETLWVRVVDVEAALVARRYAVTDRLVIEVEDPFCPRNNGRFELRGDPGGAECWRTDEEPDLVMQAPDLGSIYLGGVPVSALVRAGRVWARSSAVVRRADLLFGWTPAPWTAHIF